MDSTANILQFCRLCLVKDGVNIPIFDEQGDIRQIYLKISSCLPVKVAREDHLPKKICDGCSNKLDICYDFWRTSAESEKQLLAWLGATGKDAAQVNVKEEDNFDEPLASDISKNDDDENKCYMFEQKVEEGPPVEINDEPPPSKRPRRTAAVKAAIAMDQNSDDDGDSGEPITKMEDDSDETDGDDREPAFVDVPSTSADDQPGPSGVSKDGSDAPCSDSRAKINKNEQMTGNEKKDDSNESNAARPAKNGNAEVVNVTLDDGICIICDSKFGTKKSLLRHLLTSHPSVIEASKRLRCNSCNDEIDNMQKHLETVHNLKGTVCPVCSKAFSKSDEVIDHFKMSHLQVIAKLICTICKSVYANMEGLMSHYQDKHKYEVKQDSAGGRTSTYRIPKKNDKTRINKVCTICENKFDTEESLSQHCFSVHHPYITQSKTWKCNKCSTICSTEEEMQNHLQAQHKVEGSFCPICYKGFMAKADVSEHLKSSHIEVITKLSCSACKLDFLNQADLISHCESKHSSASKKTIAPSTDEPKMWRCKNCVTTFVDTEEEVKKHLEMNHKIEGNWCPICDKDCDTVFETIEHLINVHVEGITKPACAICKKEFNSYDDLISHFQEKHGEVAKKNQSLTVLCILCDTKFKTKSHMVKHCRFKHSQIFKECKVWQCLACESGFIASEEIIQKHLESKHKVNGNVCSICRTTLGTSEAAMEHVKSSHVLTATKPSCSVCNIVMGNDTRVVIHYHEKHQLQPQPTAEKESTASNVSVQKKEGAKKESTVPNVQKKDPSGKKESTGTKAGAVKTSTGRFECHVCSEKFMCDLDLALHLADAHKVVLFNTDFEKQKVFGCSSCVAKFSTRELAVEHVTRKHSGISDPIAEKYNCSYCNLTMNKKNFRSHLVRCVILSGQLRCRFCLVKIDNKELLQQHMTTKHPTEEDSGLGWTTKSLPFGCPVCQKAFPSDEAVLCHAQIKHPLRIRKNAPPVPLETTLAVTHKDGMTYYKCPFCKYTTPMLSLITKHIFAKHKDRKDEISDPISIGMTQGSSQGSSQGTSSNCTSLGKRPLVSEKPSPPGPSNKNAYMSEKRFRSGTSSSYKARASRASEASGFAKSVNQYRATKSYDSRNRMSYRGIEPRLSPWLADTSPAYENRPYKAVVQSGAVVGFECVVCGQSYLSHAALDMHMKVNH